MKAAFVLSSSLALASAICHHGTKSFARRAEDIVKPNFGYTDLLGPVVWQGLSAEAEVCATGKHQSPIAINRNNSQSVKGSSLNFDVQSYPNGAEFLNLGTTLEVLANGSMTLNDEDYSLVQYHIHTPSEHRIHEEYYPMEVHFVFQAEDESLAVVGIMVEVAGSEETADFVTSTFDNLAKASHAGNVTTTPALDFSELKDHINTSTVWQYSGSLTVPPCNEGVSWNVVEEPVYMNSTLFRDIKKTVKFNSRFTQNNPGHTNILDRARSLLNGQIKPKSGEIENGVLDVEE